MHPSYDFKILALSDLKVTRLLQLGQDWSYFGFLKIFHNLTECFFLILQKRIILPEETDYTAPKKSRIAHNRSHQTQEGKNSPSDSHSQPPTPQGATYKPPTPQGATYKPPTPQGGYKPPTPQGGSYHPSVSSPSISTTKCSPDSSYSSDPTPAAKAIPKNACDIREEREERYSSHNAGKENSHHHNHHHHQHQENHSPAGQVSSSAPDYIMYVLLLTF